MSQLLLERLVYVTSEEMIDSLKPRSVVCVRNSDARVFDRKEGDMMFFYYPDVIGRDIVVELKTPRSHVSNSGNQIYFHMSSRDVRKEFTSKDGDYYLERRNDLVSLGLMKEETSTSRD